MAAGDLAQAEGLASALGAFFGGLGGFLGGRRGRAAHLRQCEDRVTNLETTVGILLSILPGGALADRFDLYRRGSDAEVARILEDTRRRFRERNLLDDPPEIP